MIKKHPLGYSKGMSQDLSKSKTDNSSYFSAKNIRIMATGQQSTFSLTNEDGNELMFGIPYLTLNTSDTVISYVSPLGDGSQSSELLPYVREGKTIPGCELEESYTPNGETTATSGDQIIIGTVDTRDGAIIATTDNNGWDCIWELYGLGSGNWSLKLKYLGKLGFSTNSLVQLMYNYENSKIEKVYFVDGTHQLRSMNLRQSVENGDIRNLIDNDADSINIVSKFSMSQPTIGGVITGGSHESGMIQYACNLYTLNGSQTTVSPLSELVSIDLGPGLGGGAVNQSLGRTVIVNVDNIDTSFTHIKLYAIKYTSYNQSPEISVIADREIDSDGSLSYPDTGAVLYAISTSEFAFLGSAPKIPNHIESKDSRLLAVNVKEKEFNVDLDTRLYGHDVNGDCVIWENIELVNTEWMRGDELNVDTSTYSVPDNHDCINRNYSDYKFTSFSNPSTLGAEGKHFKLIVKKTPMTEAESVKHQYLKDKEIYRFAIEFFNDLGQSSDPKWMADIQAPSGNLEGTYNTIEFEVKPEFTSWLNTTQFGDNQKPVGYRLLRADRTLSDMTIIAQGLINPMVANYKHTGDKLSGRDYAHLDQTSKMPSMVRVFDYDVQPMRAVRDYADLSENVEGRWYYGRDTETIDANSRDDYRAQTCQFSRLMQMFTPELLFSNFEIDSSFKLRVLGMVRNQGVFSWGAEADPRTLIKTLEAKFENSLTSYNATNIEQIGVGNPDGIADIGFFGPTNDPDEINAYQVYRRFGGVNGFGFLKSSTTTEYDIYGSPEITERGADFTNYNNDGSLRYSNHLLDLLQDNWENNDNVNDDSANQVLGCSALGARCITFAEGPDESSYPIENRKQIERLKNDTGNTTTGAVLIAEFTKPNTYLYTGSMYGGTSYEAKSASSYIRIGDYNNISENTSIISPGDTFVQEFKFTKFSKSDEQITSRAFNQLTEIVSIKVETTIDLKNRNDNSIDEWDNDWQPKYEEFQDYNRVYSQQSNLLQATGLGFKFKKINEFDTRVISTKVKIPGEDIDSWTDFLENEVIDLDGKYGPINATLNFNDEIFLFQDSAVAHLSVNPRVQTLGSDGVSVELGSGGVLHDYQYLTTMSGSLNKRGVIAAQNAFYYFDLNNKSIMMSNGQSVTDLSEQKGFHSFFTNNIGYSDLIIDNPVLSTGVSIGYNSNNNEVYFTFLQNDFYNPANEKRPDYRNDFTICYNENLQIFTSFYDYTPAWYINKGSKMLSTGKSSKDLWEHFKGAKGSFYGITHYSEIVFNVHPNQGSGNYTFNNLSYKMEMKGEYDEDLLNETFSLVRLNNEYQYTDFTPIVIRNNAKRRNRDWSITLPRASGSRDRIRSPWASITLRLDNSGDYKMIAHDLIMSYTEY